MMPKKSEVIDSNYRNFVESIYSPVPRDAGERIIDNIVSLTELAADRRQSLRAILEQTAKTIFKLFGFREVGIGMKSREDGFYRYEVLFGYGKDVADNFRRMKYNYDDMVSQEKFPHIRMGKLSELNPVEGLPDVEKDLFNRPFQLTVKRETPEEFHEGDYIDVWMYGANREILGWFELSDPVDDKLPPRSTVRWLELLASICASIVLQKWAEEDSARR